MLGDCKTNAERRERREKLEQQAIQEFLDVGFTEKQAKLLLEKFQKKPKSNDRVYPAKHSSPRELRFGEGY